MPAARRTPRHSLLRAFALACALLGVLSGCAPGALQREAGKVKLPTTDSAFNVAGRLSARHGADSFAASFRWQHDADRDQLEFSSPLGQTVAALSGDSNGVRLQAADGRVLTADNWTALTERGLGWRLPVEGLVFWIQGAPRDGAPYSVEPDEADRVGVLRQDGWTIVYLAYGEGQEPVARPSRMTLSYPDIELRMAVDSWH